MKSYVGVAPCGCYKMAIMDVAYSKEELARELAKVIRQGLTIERVTNEMVRAGSWGCVLCQPPSTPEKQAVMEGLP